LCPRDRVLQLLRQLSGFRFSRGERVHEFGQFLLSHIWLELNAGEPRSTQQLRKLLLGRGTLKRHTIQQQLCSCRAEQQAAVGILWNCGAQFSPGNIQLFHSSSVVVSVQACKLQ
jgi:hypothetical protein